MKIELEEMKGGGWVGWEEKGTGRSRWGVRVPGIGRWGEVEGRA
jgi:hypothetical protein